MNVYRSKASLGERHLLIKIIFRAVYDWKLYRSSPDLTSRRMAGAAYTWLYCGPEGSGAPKGFFFLEICEALSLDPSKIREVFLSVSLEEASRLYRGGTLKGDTWLDTDKEAPGKVDE
jgi:hypothetical protein